MLSWRETGTQRLVCDTGTMRHHPEGCREELGQVALHRHDVGGTRRLGSCPPPRLTPLLGLPSRLPQGRLLSRLSQVPGDTPPPPPTISCLQISFSADCACFSSPPRNPQTQRLRRAFAR